MSLSSAGICTAATPIPAPIGVGFAGTGISEAVGVDRATDSYEIELGQIRETENKLLGRFALASISD